MPRWIALCLGMIALLFPRPGSAQESLKLSLLEVDIRPEYDQPTVLVIYRVTLASQTSLPVELTFSIPAVAGEPHAVAVRSVDGQLLNAVYDRQVSGDWASIKITATTPEVQLEYYDPSLRKQGDARHFEYRWPGDYAVDSLVIQVQQPVDSSQMRISPSLGGGSQGQDGLTYYTAQVGSLAAGQNFTITLDYQKSTERLSAETLPVQPSQPLSPDTRGRIRLTSALPWVLGMLGLALIVGGGLWYWRSGREEAQTQKRRKPPAAATYRAEEVQAQDGVYCHQCGKRALPGDRFCRSCGARLRTE